MGQQRGARLLIWRACPAGPLDACSGARAAPELQAIYQRGLQLYQAGKYADAVPIAEEYVGVAAARYGEQHQIYATALG